MWITNIVNTAKTVKKNTVAMQGRCYSSHTVQIYLFIHLFIDRASGFSTLHHSWTTRHKLTLTVAQLTHEKTKTIY